MFVVAKEDNSITEFGNKFIRDNFTDATVPAYRIEVPDAGHWSVSDLDGLVDIFKAGCGDAVRQTDGTDFTYLDPSSAAAGSPPPTRPPSSRRRCSTKPVLAPTSSPRAARSVYLSR